jgi:hypothetical protein
MILEISIVSRLLVDMASTSTCLSNANTEGILNECFSYSEDSNSNLKTELLLVLEQVLLGIYILTRNSFHKRLGDGI